MTSSFSSQKFTRAGEILNRLSQKSIVHLWGCFYFPNKYCSPGLLFFSQSTWGNVLGIVFHFSLHSLFLILQQPCFRTASPLLLELWCVVLFIAGIYMLRSNQTPWIIPLWRSPSAEFWELRHENLHILANRVGTILLLVYISEAGVSGDNLQCWLKLA